MELPPILHFGLTFATHLSMVPSWLESWWAAPSTEAWDITYANSFYRANPTAVLMWIFATWRHDVILGLLVFAVLTGVLVFAFLLFCTIRWCWNGISRVCDRSYSHRRGTAGSHRIRDADLVELPEEDTSVSHCTNPQIITPEDPRSPNHPASPIEDIAPLPSIEAPSIPALEWQETTTGAVVRTTSRFSRRLRSNSVPRRP